MSLYFLSILRRAPCPSPVTLGFALPASLQRLTGSASHDVADGGQGTGFAEVVPLIQSERKANLFARL